MVADAPVPGIAPVAPAPEEGQAAAVLVGVLLAPVEAQPGALAALLAVPLVRVELPGPGVHLLDLGRAPERVQRREGHALVARLGLVDLVERPEPAPGALAQFVVVALPGLPQREHVEGVLGRVLVLLVAHVDDRPEVPGRVEPVAVVDGVQRPEALAVRVVGRVVVEAHQRPGPVEGPEAGLRVAGPAEEGPEHGVRGVAAAVRLAVEGEEQPLALLALGLEPHGVGLPLEEGPEEEPGLVPALVDVVADDRPGAPARPAGAGGAREEGPEEVRGLAPRALAVDVEREEHELDAVEREEALEHAAEGEP